MQQSEIKKLFGTNGIRGIFGNDLNSEFILDVSYSIGSYFDENSSIMLGYDGRNSNIILNLLVSSGLRYSGINIESIGLVPTPCLQFATKYFKKDGGLMITASHNPPNYNGLKLISRDGVEISRSEEKVIEDIYHSKKYRSASKIGGFSFNEFVIEKYIENILLLVNKNEIRKRNFKVVVDLGNGAQSVLIPKLLMEIGCSVITLNGEIDGNFSARGSEPSQDNLTSLSNMVTSSKANFGVAYDGDGDRSIFCDDKGVLYPGDKSAAILLRYLLQEKHKGEEIVCPINTTNTISYIAKELGSNIIYTKVGSVEVSREMVKRNSLFGLEENGGFMYGKFNQVRDGALTTILMLDMLASYSSNVGISTLFSSLPKTYQYKSKFNCSDRETIEKILQICSSHGNPLRIESLDGIKIWIDEESWIMMRPSGTEPIIRIYAESNDHSLLNSKINEYNRLILSILKD